MIAVSHKSVQKTQRGPLMTQSDGRFGTVAWGRSRHSTPEPGVVRGFMKPVGLLLAWALAAPAASQTLTFVDATASSRLGGAYNPGGFAQSEYCGGGAVGDFDRDGWPDLFLLSGSASGLPDRLFMNNGDGTFRDDAAAWGLTDVHDGRGVAVGDIDGDGWLDLFVTSTDVPAGPGQHRLYRNIDGQSFVDVASSAGLAYTDPDRGDGLGAAWGDYDLDGDLDLFVAGFTPFNQGSRLFRNRGDGTFVDATVVSRLFSKTPSIAAFAPRFCDMNGDRYPELLLAADFGTSRYFKNLGNGTFVDWTNEAQVGIDENGMGQAIGDWDGDARPDWYVTSIHLPEKSYTGNKLYLNRGNHSFIEVATQAGVDDGDFGWGAVGVDFNHDGWLDIAETNGGIKPPFLGNQSYLWLNDGQMRFREVGRAIGFDHSGQGRGLLHLDYDGDGDQDIIVIGFREPVRLYRNDLSGPDSHWLRVLLDTSAARGIAPDGYGARVELVSGGRTQSRWVVGGDAYLSQSELSAHFGLGAAMTVDSLTIHWPDGRTTTLVDIPADRTLTVCAPGPIQTLCTCGSGAPCGNADADAGCANSTGNGGLLEAFSSTSVVADDLRLLATHLPPTQVAFVFMGSAESAPHPLGDGLRCAGGALWRFPVRLADVSGRIVEGPRLAAWTRQHLPPAGWLEAGDTWVFQTWYRDPTGPCGTGSNVSNALSVTFTP